MKNKIIAALVAGGLLVGAGLVTALISAPGTAAAQEEGTDDDTQGPFPRILGFLGEILDELVGDGTITQDQADAISEAAEEKATDIQQERRELHELIQELLDDGVLTEEEAEQLPDDHFLLSDAFDEAWADGELTIAEIRRYGPFPRHRAFRHGFRLGAILDDGGIDQDEYDSLDEDHWLKQVDVSEYLEDGLITPEELRELFQEHMPSDGDNT